VDSSVGAASPVGVGSQVAADMHAGRLVVSTARLAEGFMAQRAADFTGEVLVASTVAVVAASTAAADTAEADTGNLKFSDF
jgi:hypothetical protein